MKKAFSLFCLLTFLPFTTFANGFGNGKWVDLTYAFSEESIYWPTADEFKKTTVFDGHTDHGFYYTAYNFSAAEHGGTHLDAPIHFSEHKNTVDQIPIDQLIAPGVVIRIHEQARQNRNYQLSVADILAWEQEHGEIAPASIVLVDTDSGKLYPDKVAYMGTDKRGKEAVKALKFPGIHPDAADFLVNQRKIKAVGLDTPSIDFGGSVLFKTHQILFKHNIPGLENVASLEKLPEKGFTIIALPMKIKGGSGAPLRIVAFIANE